MDDALVQDDGTDLIVEELDRCWEVSQDQDKASKIEKAFFETQRDVKMETTFISNVARRKLNFQQLENSLGALPSVIKGYATLRDAELAESSHDKVMMWTGGSYDYDDVVRALVRLDRPEMRPRTSGHSGKTVPTFFTDPEVDAPTIVPGSEFWTQPSVDRPHWNEIFDALQEDADFCEDGETTTARDERSPFRVFSTLPTMTRRRPWKRPKCHRYYCRLDQPFDILDTGLSERSFNAAQKARGFFGRQRAGTALDPRCARCRKLGHWARECPEGNRGQRNDERYDRRAGRLEDNSEAFIAPPGHSSLLTLEKCCGILVPKKN